MTNEESRLAALYRLNILDTPAEESFDRITRLAQVALQMPIVMVSLVDRDRQWFKSKQGMDDVETPKCFSFCAHAIAQEEPFIVEDATKHPLFADNPQVVGEPYIRYYIGIPLIMRDGFIIGTLCAIDRRPRQLSVEQIDVLCDLGRIVINEIELRQIATTDSLTGALTRRGFDIEMACEFDRAKQSRREFSLVAIDIDHFKSVNDRYGHASGDLVLRSVMRLIRQDLKSDARVARLGGEEFVIVLPKTGIADATALAERIRQTIADTKMRVQSDTICITASFGISSFEPSDEAWPATLEKADAALYEAKRNGRNKCVGFGLRASGIAAA